MIMNAKPMACGNCGYGLFRMFDHGPNQLLAECTTCNSVSTIMPSMPTIDIGWGEGAEGILCQMEPKS